MSLRSLPSLAPLGTSLLGCCWYNGLPVPRPPDLWSRVLSELKTHSTPHLLHHWAGMRRDESILHYWGESNSWHLVKWIVHVSTCIDFAALGWHCVQVLRGFMSVMAYVIRDSKESQDIWYLSLREWPIGSMVFAQWTARQWEEVLHHFYI